MAQSELIFDINMNTINTQILLFLISRMKNVNILKILPEQIINLLNKTDTLLHGSVIYVKIIKIIRIIRIIKIINHQNHQNQSSSESSSIIKIIKIITIITVFF